MLPDKEGARTHKEQHVKRSRWQGDKPVIDMNFGKKQKPK